MYVGKRVSSDHHDCVLMRWALFRMLYGSFQALQKPLGVFLIQESYRPPKPLVSSSISLFNNMNEQTEATYQSPSRRINKTEATYQNQSKIG